MPVPPSSSSRRAITRMRRGRWSSCRSALITPNIEAGCPPKRCTRTWSARAQALSPTHGDDMLLNSMKVVSFCHVLQGPSCTQYLGDMGAQITKIEPLGGERSRRWAGAEMPGGVSGLYLCAFRNKRLFSVDLKSAEGREVVLSLIDKADVVIENFRHGVMERLGLSYEDIRKRKPDIIYASGTGWGGKGPMLTRESQDLIIQARTGLASATGKGRG